VAGLRLVFDGFDAREVDVDGRIRVLLTFGGGAPDSTRTPGA
jgi:hypothetical protein